MPFPILAAAIPAVAGIASSLIGNSAASKAAAESLEATRETNQTNIMLQREQRTWDAEQTNTEVQRRVADLQAAGLNPMLAYQGQAGSAAPAPPVVESGAGAYTAKAQSQIKSLDSATAGITNALQVAQFAATIKNLDADTAVKTAQAGLTNETTRKAAYETAISGNTAARIPIANQQQMLDLDETRERILNIVKDTGNKDLTQSQLAQMVPLLVDYQRILNTGAVLQNKATSLGNTAKDVGIEGGKLDNLLKQLELPEKKAGATFYEQTGPSAKWMETVKQILSILRNK